MNNLLNSPWISELGARASSIELSWPMLAVMAGLAIVFAALWCCFACCRSIARFERRVLAALAEVERDLRVVGVSLIDAGHRVEHVEGDLRTLEHAQHSLESRATGSSNFAQAVSLVRRGWRIDDLMSTCGLTRGEAELVYLLHGPGGALKAPASPEKNN